MIDPGIISTKDGFGAVRDSRPFHIRIVEQFAVTLDAGSVALTQRIVVRAAVTGIPENGEDGKAGNGHQ